ncbi:carboxylesterase/lipase family protein [Lentzea flava]|uniref:Carboxylic ester hydrolase n=1 Tax=Lentzea flava TaxID=103732 RepID=A0ABQ2UDG7_9PSEU|nr:carboxylesterase family protein [Lentzea flava]MCP2197442.1 para-nitrobenzyl esterase [Lentzea flava]GGU19698.1 carboxylic ester hydrolase [Lentzea flava]
MNKRLSLLIAAALLASPVGVAQASEPGLVRTDAGPVRGTVLADRQVYQGIPYAAPPVGELRWRSPQPVAPWTTPRDATRPGPVCAQSAGAGSPSSNEDCLYLNVTTPSTHGRRPVMVYLHGGGNSYLSGDGFNPRRLVVQGDVVVVTINYRLGFFGFFGHPDLPESGAYGIEDQQAALRWVQRNAAAFGGDPRNVTVFGESGGAFDVCAHVTSPKSRGLFQKAIAQSGGCSTKWGANGVIHDKPAGAPWITKDAAAADAVAISAQLGCSDVACLRALPPTAFTAIDRGATPVVTGNSVLPVHPVDALKSGRFNRVPVIWGNTRDEGRLTSATVPEPFDYQALLVQGFGQEKAAKIAAEYPEGESARLAYGSVLTDGVWACNQLSDDRLLSRYTPTYGYEFADRTAPVGWFKDLFSESFPGGAAHSFDLAYFFDIPMFDLNPAQQQLASTMIRDWTTFARTGKPGWARGTVQEYSLERVGPINGLTRHNCSFWNSIG